MARFSILAIALAISTSASAAEDIILLEPNGDWVVQPSEHQCRLIRPFQNAGKDFVMVLEPQLAGTKSFLKIIEPDGAPKERVHSEKPHLFLDGMETKGFSGVNRYAVGDDGRAILQIFVHWKEIPLAEVNEGIDIDAQKLGSYSIRTGPLATPLRQLEECQELTRGLYGFTPEETRRIAVFPEMKSKPVNSARMKDVDFADGKGAEHLLRIGADGQMKACFIIGSISTPQEQKESCESITLMEEFTPALDIEGNPIEAPYYLSYRTLVRTFTIPRDH